MSIDVPTCPLAITSTTLSAWQDDLLDDAEAQQIAAHIDACPVCQRTIAQFDRIAGAIQHLAPPDLRAQSWRGIRAGLAPRRRWPVIPPALRSSTLATACLVVLVALFATVLHQHPSAAPSTSLATNIPPTIVPFPSWTPTTIPTPTTVPTPINLTVINASGPPVPGPHPNWQTHKLPYGIIPVIGEGTYTLSVAPSDGNTAYACDGFASTGPFTVIVTHDRAAHWTRVTTVPTCSPVTIDDLNPNIVVIGNSITFNGGYTWQQPPSLKSAPDFYSFATRGNYIYAVFVAPSQSATLAVSRDGLQTWTPIGQGIMLGPPPYTFTHLWLSPSGSDMLVETAQNGDLWHSLDAGQHWAQVALPQSPQGVFYSSEIFHYDSTQHGWHICSSYTTQNDPAQDEHPRMVTQCTRDLGRSWTQLPDLQIDYGDNYGLLGIEPDGTLVASLFFLPHASVQYTQVLIMCLPVGATRWQNLGAQPDIGAGVAYVSGTGNGTLWEFPSNRMDESLLATAPMP